MNLFSDVIHGGHGDKETLAEAKEFAKGFEYQKKDGWEPDTHSLSDPTFSGNCIKEKELPLINKFIHSTLIEYLEQLGHSQNTIQGFDIVESWLTNTKNGEYAKQHHHGTTDVSGVYYIQSNPDTDGNLYFVAPDVIRNAKALYRMLHNCLLYTSDAADEP